MDALQMLAGLEDDDFEFAGYGAEIVGADDDDDIAAILSGELGYEELGRALKKKKKTAAMRAMMMAMAGKGRGLQPVRNRELRRYPLGLGATSLGAGTTAIISANPQLPFRVARLVTPSTGLLIENIQVGTQSQFVAAGAVPTEVFAPDAQDVELRGDTAVPGVSVQITVSNPTGGALVFSGAIIGLVAQ
jgi:hypothetical protein